MSFDPVNALSNWLANPPFNAASDVVSVKVSVGTLLAMAEPLIVTPPRKIPSTGSATVTQTALVDWPLTAPTERPAH